MLPHRPLGRSGLNVSVLSLGSWMTFEHLPMETGVATMVAARECGIDFLDDARYDDRTGRAPIPTGYSEVVFGELFRAAGFRRDEVVVANKLWLEHWPDESIRAELDGSLARMRFEHLDLVYCAPPPRSSAVVDIVTSIADLVASGKVRAWGVLNWSPSQLRDAIEAARDTGSPSPCAAQLPYSLTLRDAVENDAIIGLLRAASINVVASAALAGGVLTGKYASPDATGRASGQADSARDQDAFQAGAQLRELAQDLSTTPAAVALAFPLANADVSSVLFGATSPQQVVENAMAPQLVSSLLPDQLAALRRIGASDKRLSSPVVTPPAPGRLNP